jgi:uncharacterized protein YaiE (UPF0345 family)
MLVLKGKLRIQNPRTGQVTVLEAGSHFLLPAQCPYTLQALEEALVFFMASSVHFGMEKLELIRDVEIE